MGEFLMLSGYFIPPAPFFLVTAYEFKKLMPFCAYIIFFFH